MLGTCLILLSLMMLGYHMPAITFVALILYYFAEGVGKEMCRGLVLTNVCCASGLEAPSGMLGKYKCVGGIYPAPSLLCHQTG